MIIGQYYYDEHNRKCLVVAESQEEKKDWFRCDGCNHLPVVPGCYIKEDSALRYRSVVYDTLGEAAV